MLSRRIGASSSGASAAQLSAAARSACRCSLNSWISSSGRTGGGTRHRAGVAGVDTRRFAVTVDDAKILQERRDAKRAVKPAVQRFKDFHGRWHEAKTTEDTAVLEDRLLSDEMRFYNTIAKGAGAAIWLSVVGVEFNLLGKLDLIDYSSIPGPLPWIACGAVAWGVAAPPTMYATLTLRRQLERHAYKIQVPSVVVFTAETPEMDHSMKMKNYVTGVYQWVIRDALERHMLRTDADVGGEQPRYNKDLQAGAPIADTASHEFQLALEAEQRLALGIDPSLPCSIVPAASDDSTEPQQVEVLQFDLVDKMRQELLRPLSGIRAELSLPAIITNIERERIERAAAALATDPALPADLDMFLRWFSRTQKLFTLEKALEESPINWWCVPSGSPRSNL